MAYRFKRGESVQAGVRRIAREQIEQAESEIEDDDLDLHETVHQVRKRCKQIRGLLRLVRTRSEDTYKKENAFFRDAAAQLSYVRDSQSVIECFDRLVGRLDRQESGSRFSAIRGELLRRREQVAEDEVGLRDRLREFLCQIREAKERIEDWSISDNEFDAIKGGMEKTYGRARMAIVIAYEDPSAENFHEWRKRVKYHRYHARLLRNVWPEILDPYRNVVSQLEDSLGDDRDLGILRSTLLDEPDRFGAAEDVNDLVGLIDDRQAELRAIARPLGERLVALKPKRMSRWFSGLWEIWRKEKMLKHLAAEPALDVTHPSAS